MELIHIANATFPIELKEHSLENLASKLRLPDC
jgi:hypothetical protein